jgi:hypothetical protein
LGRETSKFLLEAIQPTVVFSGDDHDYCDVTHPNGVQEVTIKTFSSDQGVRRPGFQLMSLIPPTENSSGQANVPCLLPDQIGVYTRIYIPLAILTFGFLLFTNIRKAWSRSVDKNKEDHHHHPLSSEKQPSQISIPSRRSSQHLQGLSSARERHLSALSPHASAPPSPIHTPLAGHSPFIGYDPELGIEHTASPPRSLRGSYTDFSQIGGGSSRHNSTNLVPPLQAAAHRVSLPRMRSTADWASAARAKDMSVLSLVTDRRRPALAYIRALAGWLWRTRKSVLVTSWWEAVSIAIPALAVWIIMNALFFHQ